MADHKRIDEDWKNQAEDEKRKIEASMTKSVAGGDSEHARNPRVSLTALIEQLASQAMAGLGQMADPRTGRPHIDLDLARDAIDMIGLLEEKTSGNLTPEEERVVGDVMNSLRSAYSSIKSAYGPADEGPGATGGSGQGGSGESGLGESGLGPGGP